MSIYEIIATLAVVTGVPLISIPRIEGLYLMLIGQVGWGITAYCNDSKALLAQSIFLLFFNLKGISNWRKKKIG